LYIPPTRGVSLFGYLIVQSPLEAGAIDKLLREQIHAWEPLLPDMPWLRAERLEDLMSASVAGPRFAATLSSAFSVLALLLAATGIFGLVSYSVSQRLREFGIRAALGAQPGDLLSTALRSAVVSTAAGVGAGLAATVFLVRFVESQLYAVEALDLPTFAAAGAIMLSVAIFSAYLPARRAARVDPAATLRAE
jgi:putative ABC transport system permease protein